MAINSIKDLWNQICEYCKQNNKISEVGINTWIIDLYPVSTDDGKLILAANNEYKKKTVESYYKKILEESCEAVSGLPMQIEIIVRETKADTKAVEEKSEVLDVDYTFENFVIGESNKMAHAAAMAVAKKPIKNRYNPLVLYGNSGVGKTHLMSAIKNSINKNFPELKIEFLRAEEFGNELFLAFRNQTTDLFHERFRSVDVLLLDDIHFIAGKDVMQEEFFNTFNALYPDKQIVVTSDRPPKEIKTLEERIRSRFESGMLVDIQQPDFETRVNILKNKSIQLNVDIDDEIIYYIAEQIKANIRQLEGMINKLQGYTLLDAGRITMPIVQRFIRDVVSETIPDPITVDRIVEEVARTYNVASEDIFSKKKTAEIAHARQIAMYIVDKTMKLSSTEIGKNFNKHHTTILYTVSKVDEMLKMNDSERNLVEDIIKNIQS